MATLTFEESRITGYRDRTIQNASADATIAFAIDFNTAGERLTKNSVLDQKKIYIPVSFDAFFPQLRISDLLIASDLLNKGNATNLNIAGNGLYTLIKRRNVWTQEWIDDYVYNFLSALFDLPKMQNKITLIRSGGQTGFDEAGIKAGLKLGIDCLVLAPKGWVFRGADGIDISDETLFKQRFS